MAGRYDLYIDQGSTFTRTFVYKDSNGVAQDLTGFTARMMIRKTHNATGDPLFDTDPFGTSLAIPVPADGSIILSMTDEDTAALPAPLEGVWDLEIEDGSGVVTRIIEGKVITSPNVTRPPPP